MLLNPLFFFFAKDSGGVEGGGLKGVFIRDATKRSRCHECRCIKRVALIYWKSSKQTARCAAARKGKEGSRREFDLRRRHSDGMGFQQIGSESCSRQSFLLLSFPGIDYGSGFRLLFTQPYASRYDSKLINVPNPPRDFMLGASLISNRLAVKPYRRLAVLN